MTDGLPKSPGHPFYRKLNELLAEAEFDRWIEGRCRQYYATDEKRRQPSLPPGVYFRMLLVGYFENLDSQRGIAWRCADSLSLRQFLGIPLDEATPDHSTLTNTRQRLPPEVFEEVFQFVRTIAQQKRLIHAAQNFAAFRNALIACLRLAGHANIASALRDCTWQTQRMLAMLGIFKK
jgi:transposase